MQQQQYFYQEHYQKESIATQFTHLFQKICTKESTIIAENTALMELPYFLKSLHCFITGDTSPLHLCSALGIPSIALFLGGASPTGSGILQDKSIRIEIQQESPELITLHQIFESLETLIKKLSIN